MSFCQKKKKKRKNMSNQIDLFFVVAVFTPLQCLWRFWDEALAFSPAIPNSSE
jgi:hypothetical protein